MMKNTIAAISTPYGEGGVGIIRISGDNAEEILRKIFVPAVPGDPVNRRMTYGHIVDEEQNIVDEVLCVLMKKPKTYTAEDVVEINCHGGMVPLRKTLELVLRSGARAAERGEFTKRAFLNGRLDLTQAEAVMDLISAKTDRTYDVAVEQMEGILSRKIRMLRNMLLDVLVDLTVNIDYPDEDIEELTYRKLFTGLDSVRQQIQTLIDSADTGRILREGLKVAIIGKPNVGKSSLMNGLLRESRAIVTEIPGTTRDTIEENLSIRGIPVILTDTAGIRRTDDKIESIGIERSKASFNEADLVILVLDGSRELEQEDYDIMEHVNPSRTIVLINKSDLPQVLSASEISSALKGARTVSGSMKDIEGLKALEDCIASRVETDTSARRESILVTNARHRDLLEEGMRSLCDAIDAVLRKEPLEIIEIDVNSAYERLGEIIGEAVADDILNEVFSRFCLGK